MKCPNCGYENAEDALSCNLCQFVLRREKPAPPPPPTPEPGALGDGAAVAALLKLALKSAGERPQESERLMARLYVELPPADAGGLLAGAAELWLKGTALQGPAKAEAQALCAAAARKVQAGDLQGANRDGQRLLGTVKDTSGDAMRMMLMLLGLKGAAVATRGPKSLDSMEAVTKLVSTAAAEVEGGRREVARRLMARLFEELDADSFRRVVDLLGEAWRQSARLPPEQDAEARRLVERGLALLAKGELDAALEAMRPALALAQGAKTNMGLALGLMGLACAVEREQARARYKELTRRALEAEGGGRPAEAVDCYEKASALFPDDGDAKARERLEALLRLARQKAAGAKAAAPAAAGESADDLVDRGRTLGRDGRLEEALACLTRALELAPGDAGAWSDKGVALMGLGRREEALRCQDEAVRLDPSLERAWRNRAVAARKLGNAHEEARSLQKVCALAPGDAGPWTELTTALQRLGRLEEAGAAALRAAALAPESMQARFLAGGLLTALRRPAEALPHLEAFLASEQPPRALAAGWEFKGECLHRLGRRAEAEACYERALALDAAHPLAAKCLALCRAGEPLPDD